MSKKNKKEKREALKKAIREEILKEQEWDRKNDLSIRMSKVKDVAMFISECLESSFKMGEFDTIPLSQSGLSGLNWLFQDFSEVIEQAFKEGY